MRSTRLAAAATTLALVGAATSIGPAGAAANGVGTAQATTTVLGVQLGDGSLLSAGLLTDDARSTTDAAVATPTQAYSKLTGLTLGSSVSALNLGAIGSFESRTPGGSPSVSGQSVTLSSTPVPAAVATGSLTLASLTSAVDAAGARSAMTAQGTDINLVGGLLSIKGISSTLGSSAASASADGTREVKVDQVAVANLGALLQGLGISLNSLLPQQVADLLTQLQATAGGLTGVQLENLVTGVQQQIITLATTPLSGTGQTLTDAVNTVVNTLGLGSIITPTTVSTITSATDATQALIDQLNAALASQLTSAVNTLAATSLLSVNGVDVGVTSKAAGALADSAAGITAKLGSVNVAGVALPGVDLLSATSAVTGLVGSVNSKLQSVLGVVSPDLASLVTVSALDQTKSVTSSGGYNRARAGITALTATVKPPANLATIVTALGNQTGTVGQLISSAGTALPVVAPAMTQLTTALGSSAQALSAGATVKVVQVLGSADFAAAATTATTPSSSLPRTGDDDLRLAAIATLLIALGLGFRVWFAHPARVEE